MALHRHRLLEMFKSRAIHLSQRGHEASSRLLYQVETYTKIEKIFSSSSFDGQESEVSRGGEDEQTRRRKTSPYLGLGVEGKSGSPLNFLSLRTRTQKRTTDSPLVKLCLLQQP